MIQHIVGIICIQLHRLGIIIFRSFKLSLLLLHSSTCGIGDGIVGILLYQHIDTIVSLSIMLVFLIEKSKTELCLEIARHQN